MNLRSLSVVLSLAFAAPVVSLCAEPVPSPNEMQFKSYVNKARAIFHDAAAAPVVVDASGNVVGRYYYSTFGPYALTSYNGQALLISLTSSRQTNFQLNWNAPGVLYTEPACAGTPYLAQSTSAVTPYYAHVLEQSGAYYALMAQAKAQTPIKVQSYRYASIAGSRDAPCSAGNGQPSLASPVEAIVPVASGALTIR